jgi:hypothetical protein
MRLRIRYPEALAVFGEPRQMEEERSQPSFEARKSARLGMTPLCYPKEVPLTSAV